MHMESLTGHLRAENEGILTKEDIFEVFFDSVGQLKYRKKNLVRLLGS